MMPALTRFRTNVVQLGGKCAHTAVQARAWFHSTNFRRPVSQAINREDLSLVVFNGHAQPAVGPISPANKLCFNSRLKPDPYSPDASLQKRLQKGTLPDAQGNNVELSIITNSTNKYHKRMAVLIQQDLDKIGQGKCRHARFPVFD
jgi:peptide/nickel transport system substrate-binding protein